MDEENSYYRFFIDFFNNIEEYYRTQFLDNIPEDEIQEGDISVIKALKSKLPKSKIKILRLKLNRNQYPHAENEIYHILHYDYNNETFQIDYSGEYNLYKIEKNKKLRREWQISDNLLQGLENGTFCGTCNEWEWWNLDVIPYDILANQERYKFDFTRSFTSWFDRPISKEFENRIDYTKKYNLEPDAILSYQQIYDKGWTPFSITEYETGIRRDKTFEDVQKDIANILLIPSVPEEIKTIFNTAKRMYVFSYMEYYFATVAMHYAYLSVESALQHKYNQVFTKEAQSIKQATKLNSNTSKIIKQTLRILEKNSLIEDSDKIFTNILEPELLTYNNRNSSNEIRLEEVITKLVQAGIIPKNKVQFYKTAQYLRNKFSHPVDPSTWLPNYAQSTLYQVAQNINFLLDSP